MPHQDLSSGTIRETREVWLLLTVETELNGDSRSTNEAASPVGAAVVSSIISSNLWQEQQPLAGAAAAVATEAVAGSATAAAATEAVRQKLKLQQ